MSDPATGDVLAIADACWPEGLQPGQGDPVILELDPAEADLARLKEIGYEVFTSVDSLRGYVRRRDRASRGPSPPMSGLPEFASELRQDTSLPHSSPCLRHHSSVPRSSVQALSRARAACQCRSPAIASGNDALSAKA